MRLVRILRPNQWYKNLLIFLPIIFSQQLANTEALLLTSIGFIALCLISSAGYIFNDLLDLRNDRLHPKKQSKMIASGKVTPATAVIYGILVGLAGYVLAAQINIYFVLFALGLLVISITYTLFFKHEAVADILVISIGFVVRAVSGSYVLTQQALPYIIPSPWLFICVFFLALFLACGKRTAEMHILQDNASAFKRSLMQYTPQLTNALMIISTTALTISYSLYSFLSIHPQLIFSLPFGLYVIFRYFTLIYQQSEIPLTLSKFYTDLRLTLGVVLWLASILAVLYLF